MGNLIHVQIVSLVSARKIEMPQLGSTRNLFSSAQLGKFQLEIITTSDQLLVCGIQGPLKVFNDTKLILDPRSLRLI